jgi:hypothetical protein
MARPRPGWKPTNGFKPGNAANPHGRGKGSRGKYPCSIWQMIEQRGDRDPIDVMSEYVSSNTVDPALKLQAAGMLASYKHGKRPAYRYIEDVVGLKAPQSLAEARQYLARISFLVADGKLDVDGAAAIKDLLQAYIDATVGSEVDQRLRALEEMAREQAARGYGASVAIVQGGMPIMPGCENLILPQTSTPTIEHQPNPWGNVPDAAASLDATPKPRPATDPDTDFIGPKRPVGRPRKRPKPEGPS